MKVSKYERFETFSAFCYRHVATDKHQRSVLDNEAQYEVFSTIEFNSTIRFNSIRVSGLADAMACFSVRHRNVPGYVTS